MKKLLSLLFIISLLSCSKEEPVKDHDLAGEWVLVQTEGQVAGSKQIGSEMPFQETYILKEDGSFKKIRTEDGEEFRMTGTFEFSDHTEGMDGKAVELFVYFNHESRSLLLANCYSTSLTEHLYLNSKNRLISLQSTCDGLGLEYEKAD